MVCPSSVGRSNERGIDVFIASLLVSNKRNLTKGILRRGTGQKGILIDLVSFSCRTGSMQTYFLTHPSCFRVKCSSILKIRACSSVRLNRQQKRTNFVIFVIAVVELGHVHHRRLVSPTALGHGGSSSCLWPCQKCTRTNVDCFCSISASTPVTSKYKSYMQQRKKKTFRVDSIQDVGNA